MTDVNDDGVTKPGLETDPASAAEAVESEMDLLARERDELLDTARRVQAEFENYKKQTMKRNTEVVEVAPSTLMAARLASSFVSSASACATNVGIRGGSPSGMVSSR